METQHGQTGMTQPASLGRLICIGFQRWKQPQLAPILNAALSRPVFVRTVKGAARLNPTSGDALVWWSAAAPDGAIELARTCGAETIRMEDGFLRSVGLGSDLIPPLSLVLDRQGIYFDPRTPSDLETILAGTRFTDEELARAGAIRAFVVEHALTKYNLEPRQAASWNSGGKPVVLVPGQVENDASIRFGCSTVNTNAGLLRAARDAHPHAFIVYKPHPDVLSGNRRGRVALSEARRWADRIEADLSVIGCIEACNALHTMTSLAGFEALLRGKRVVTYGQPFYAGWGLTTDHETEGAALRRRNRTLTLDELVAGTLLRYPLYWDDEAKSCTDCETVMRRLLDRRSALESSGSLQHLRTGYMRRQFRKGFRLIREWLTPV